MTTRSRSTTTATYSHHHYRNGSLFRFSITFLIFFFLCLSQLIQTTVAHNASISNAQQEAKTPLVLKLPTEISISESELPFIIFKKETGKNISLQDIHVDFHRSIHALYISKDLNWFGHVHPEDLPNPRMRLPLKISKPGVYLVVMGFRLKDSNDDAQLKGFVTVTSAAADSSVKPNSTQPSQGTPSVLNQESLLFTGLPYPFQDNQVFMDILDLSTSVDSRKPIYFSSLSFVNRPLKSRECQPAQVNYFFQNQDQLITSDFSLIPYLNAAAHITIVKDDLSWIGHTHAMPSSMVSESSPSNTLQSICEHKMDADMAHTGPPAKFEPSVTFDLDVPEPGFYKLFVQVGLEGDKLMVSSFTAEFF